MKTDTNIRDDVENELRWDPSLDEKGILIKVKDGVVSLQGSVPHFSDRWTAEQVTKRVAGVRAIANDIEVKLPNSGERLDSDIAAAAANALKWHFALESSAILVGSQTRLGHPLRTRVLRLSEDHCRGRGALLTRCEGRLQRNRSAIRCQSEGRQTEDPKRLPAPGFPGCQGHQGQCG